MKLFNISITNRIAEGHHARITRNLKSARSQQAYDAWRARIGVMLVEK